MSRKPTTLRYVVELYLVIVGGAYTLTALVALIANTHFLLTSAEKSEIREVRGDIGEKWIMLVLASLILTSGVGVYLRRRWGLVLAGVMGICAVGYALTQMRMDGWEYHTFTIALPMLGILLCTLLPMTWREFEGRSLETS
jgi:hypothetical protein